jgi:hypothetical protein
MDYPTVDKQTLDLIKYPPLYPPIVSYGEDDRFASNNLRGKLWQFCYRYKYDIKMKSVFSPYSELLIPQGEELPNGDFNPNFHLNNLIAIKLNTGHFTVDEIEVGFRSGNKGNLYVFDVIKKFESKALTGTLYPDSNKIDHVGLHGGILIDEIKEGMVIKTIAGQMYDINGRYIIEVDIANETIYLNAPPTIIFPLGSYDISNAQIDDEIVYSIFRNNKVVEPIGSQEANEPFDGVPLYAGSMEAIESNRLVLGDTISGFPNVDMNVDITIQHTALNDLLNKYTFTKEFYYDVSGVRKVFLRMPDTLTHGQFLYINFRFIDRFTSDVIIATASYYYNENTPETIEAIVSYLITSINRKNNIGESGDRNFNFHTMLADASEYPLNDYDSVESFTQGAVVKYNNRLYISSQSVGSHHAPTGSTSDNDFWDYFCQISEMDRCMVMRALPLGSNGTFYNYFLELSSAQIYIGQQTYPIFKQGCKVNVAIEYTDYAGRLTAANENSRMVIDIPYIDTIPATPFLHNAISNHLIIKVKNIPPETAYSYRVLIDRNTPWFYQFFFYGLGHGSPDIVDDGSHYLINVNRSIQNLRDFLPKSRLNPYLFEKGDRIRIIAYKSLSTNISTNFWVRIQDILDSEIIGYDYPEATETSTTYLKDDEGEFIKDAEGNKVRNKSTGHIIVEKFKSNIAFDHATYVIYEIYRPSKIAGDNTLRFETSRAFEIGNPGETGRYHKGNTNQDPDNPITTPAIIQFYNGNAYRKLRYSGEANIYFPVESMELSDFYESDSISIGRTNVTSKDLGQVPEPNGYCWTGKLLEGTNINRLNKFFLGSEDKPADKGQLQSKYGKITILREKGYVLHAIQDRKPTSMYIGRLSLTNPDGTEDIKMLTNAVFGTIRPEESDFGCQDHTSVCKSENYVYFWDGINSKFCRKAYNGIIPISEYGQNNRFEDINSVMKYASGKMVMCTYDSRYDEVIVTMKYLDRIEYTNSLTGSYYSGDNKITHVGEFGGDNINLIKVGMILADIVLPGGYDPIEFPIIVERVDIRNRTIYIDSSYDFDTDVHSNPVQLSASIYQRYETITLAFHESANAWKTRFSFIPEHYLPIGDDLLAFKNGKTWLQDALEGDSNYNNFFGIPFWQEFHVPHNIGQIILYNGIGLKSNKKWGMIDKGDVILKVDEDRGIDMESRLPIERFRNVEGVLYASFLRDMNTPGFSNEVYALTSGRFLRGHSCILKMSNFESEKVTLFELIMYFTPS